MNPRIPSCTIGKYIIYRPKTAIWAVLFRGLAYVCLISTLLSFGASVGFGYLFDDYQQIWMFEVSTNIFPAIFLFGILTIITGTVTIFALPLKHYVKKKK